MKSYFVLINAFRFSWRKPLPKMRVLSVKFIVLKICGKILKVYEPRYIAYLATSGSKWETTK